jgi:hypothetical protein
MSTCAICFDEIDVAVTGCTTLSCQHAFHYSCITAWFLNTHNQSSCPCCRKVMGPMEDVPYEQEDEEDEDEDEDDDDDDDTDASFFFYGELNRLIRSRGGQSITMAQWLRMPLQEEQACFSGIDELNNLLIGKNAMPLTQEEWCHVPCNNFVENALPYAETVVVHLLEDGAWAEHCMNPEDRTGIAVCLVKDDTPAASILANLLAKKIQKKWRSTQPIPLQQLEAQLMAA